MDFGMYLLNLEKLLSYLHELKNERHNLNRKIRRIKNTFDWVMYGIGNNELYTLEMKKAGVTCQIHKIRSQMQQLLPPRPRT